MAISANDIKFYLSGGAGNSNPNASLGGVISSTQIVDATLNNLFDTVTGDEAAAGDIEYRAFFVKNTHSTLTWIGTKVWIQSNTPGGDDVAIAIETTKGSGKQTIVNESTAPTGVSFSAPTMKSEGLTLGDLLPNDVYLVWVKRNVPLNTAAYDNNNFVLKFEGDSNA